MRHTPSTEEATFNYAYDLKIEGYDPKKEESIILILRHFLGVPEGKAFGYSWRGGILACKFTLKHSAEDEFEYICAEIWRVNEGYCKVTAEVEYLEVQPNGVFESEFGDHVDPKNRERILVPQVCGECGFKNAACMNCNKHYENVLGVLTHCQEEACRKVNAHLRSLGCGWEVSAEGKGIVRLDGTFVPWQERKA